MKLNTKLTKTRGFDVWLAVGRNNLKGHRALNQSLAELDLSLAQHEILLAIRQNPGITQKALAASLLVVKSNVSALIKKLEGRGLVHRECDPADARNKCLGLTKAGHELVLKSFARQNKIIDAMTAVMSDEDLERMAAITRRVSDALDELLEE